jgi:hypothetical protein
MEIKKDERPDVLLLYDGLAMDMHAMRFAEALLKDNDELRAALVERVPLTRYGIESALTKAIKDRKLSWLGFKKDSGGVFSVPVLSECHYQIAAAVEAAHGIKEKPLFADLIATHEGLAEELRAVDNIKES